MTDRHSGYIVTLTDDIREDDAENIIGALAMVKGVASVHPIVADVPEIMARERVKWQLRQRVFDAVHAAFEEVP